MKKYIPILASSLLVLFGYFLYHPESLNLCESINGYFRNCLWSRDVSRQIGEPFFLYGLTTLPLGIGVLFASEAGFKKFLKFAGWWIPLSAVLIFLAPTSGGTFFPMFDMTKEGVGWILGALFSIIGLTLALRKSKQS